MKIRILIPVYRPLPTDGERRAIANNVRLLAAYDVAFVAPEGLDMTPYAALAPEAEVVRVGEEWLGSRNGIAGYNAMMLSERFYRLSEAWTISSSAIPTHGSSVTRWPHGPHADMIVSPPRGCGAQSMTCRSSQWMPSPPSTRS